MPHRQGDRLALLLLVVAIAGCRPAPTSSSGLVRVVTTTTVFADMVASVGGDLVEVTSLVPKNGDVHTFGPKPADIRAVAQADLLVMNGLGLDDWLEKTIANASKKGTALVKLGVDLGVRLLPGEEPGTQNPHLWLDVGYAKQYVDRIVVALQAADAAHSDQYQRQGAAYRARLDELDRWVREQVASIPEPNRKIVTFHDAFPYYAREYGITIVGVAVRAPGQDPSAGDTAALVEAIRAAGVKAIFSEAQFPAKLVEQLAAETGTRVVADLYDDSVGDPPVSTYEAVVRWDTQRLVDALR
ncbi:MAG: metal ABC transporter substrate-binding protein [Chloroflexota bacterium]|nr:metal ABC transporter substrate-binding protein [Chloroflexota bacterium]